MIAIFGLGNPGEKYAKTRHNAGFLIIDELYKHLMRNPRFDVKRWELSSKFQAWIAEVKGKEEGLFLLKPNTFMNNSGLSVSRFMDWYKDEITKDLVVIHDDLDIDLGKWKVGFGRGPKGHNGLISIVQQFGTSEFWRVRIGVENRPEDAREQISGQDYVLQAMSEDELVNLMRAGDGALNELRQKFPQYFEN